MLAKRLEKYGYIVEPGATEILSLHFWPPFDILPLPYVVRLLTAYLKLQNNTPGSGNPVSGGEVGGNTPEVGSLSELAYPSE